METPKTSENGLKILTVCGENDRKHLNSCIMTSNLVSPPSSPSFSHIGDYIGMESCVDLKNDDGEEDVNVTPANSDDDDEDSTGFRSRRYQCRRDRRWAMKNRDFPPPISLLARTENQPSLTPFVLKRYYTGDGRLILREERVRHHEYFKVHRSNGHLTLQLVHIHHDDIGVTPMADHLDHLDYQYDEKSQCNPAEEEEEEVPETVLETGDCGEKNEFVDEKDIVDKEVEAEPVEKYNAFESSSSAENESVGIVGGGAAANKCLNYSNVMMSSSCFLGLPVPAAKPVHT